MSQRKIKSLPGPVPIHRRQQDFTGAERNHFLGVFDGIDTGRVAAAMGKYLPALRAAGTLDALGIDCDHDALITEFLGSLLDEFAAADRGAVDRYLVGAGPQQGADIVDGANPAAYRQRHEAGLRRALDDVEHDAAIFMRGRDVKKAQLIGTGGI